jgi:hypothetical protein
MGDLSNFERGQIVGKHLAGASLTKTATLVRVQRATVSKAVSPYTNHGKTRSAKRNSGRNSTLLEIHPLSWRRIVSKNHITAAQVTAELKMY